MRIVGISQSVMGQLFFKTRDKLKRVYPEAKDENGYVYALPDPHDTRSKRYKILSEKMPSYQMIRIFISHFDRIETCQQFKFQQLNILKIEFHEKEQIRYGELDYVPRDLIEGTSTKHKLLLCCDNCKRIIENTRCDGVKKSGFIYEYECPLQDIVLRKRLEKNKLAYEDLETKANQVALNCLTCA